MRGFVLVSLAVLLSFCGPSAVADKITTDPNQAGSTPATPSTPRDLRLEQRITYTAIGKRLHAVLEELSGKTGVAIRCGSSEKDWQVRDIPVAVMARDLPLGRLLRAIADCTHLGLSTTTDGEYRYKIYLDAGDRKLEEDYTKRRTEAGWAVSKWDWDVWSKLGNIPDSQLRAACPKETPDQQQRGYEEVREVAKVFATLGAEDKQKVFSGQELRLKANDPSNPAAGSVEKLYRIAAPRFNVGAESTSDELNGVELRISIGMEPAPTLYAILMGRQVSGQFYSSLPVWTRSLTGEEPHYLNELIVKQDLPKSLLELTGGEDPNVDAYWDRLPILQEKIKLPDTKEPAKLTVAELALLTSKASGFSLVFEDFPHGSLSDETLAEMIGKEVTVGTALRDLMWQGNVDWFLDEKNKLVIGPSDDWCEEHANLVPESLLLRLREKLAGDGVQLDDILPVVFLTGDQQGEWIGRSDDLRGLQWDMKPVEKPLWSVYASLSDSDKALAKSDDGFPLGRLDPTRVSAAFAEVAKAYQEDVPPGGIYEDNMRLALESQPDLNNRLRQASAAYREAHPEEFASLRDASRDERRQTMMRMTEQAIAQIPELQVSKEVPTDPLVIGKLVLRVIGVQQRGGAIQLAGQSAPTVSPEEELRKRLKKQSYMLDVQGEGVKYFVDGPRLSFPIYSEAREKELMEQVRKASEADKKTPQH